MNRSFWLKNEKNKGGIGQRLGFLSLACTSPAARCSCTSQLWVFRLPDSTRVGSAFSAGCRLTGDFKGADYIFPDNLRVRSGWIIQGCLCSMSTRLHVDMHRVDQLRSKQLTRQKISLTDESSTDVEKRLNENMFPPSVLTPPCLR